MSSLTARAYPTTTTTSELRLVTNDGPLQDWIPLIPVDSPAPPGGASFDGVQTNKLALAHLYMKFDWHPAPVHSFTLPLWFGGLYDEQREARE